MATMIETRPTGARGTTAQRDQLIAAAGALRQEVGRRIVGQEQVLDEVLMALLAGGHALLVGVPGLAKTLLIRSIAEATHLMFRRVQFTPDLVPSDVTGTEVMEEDQVTRKREFRFVEGPVFTNILLADEINRTPPRTQAALLEAMQEHRVTAAGETRGLPAPFFVLATQNPIEQEGTYPLPEAQLDRFTMRLSLGYPPLAEEARMLAQQTTEPPQDFLEPVCTAAEVLAVAEDAKAVYVEESVNRYVVALLRHTRADQRLYLGASPRAGIALLRVAKARSLTAGRSFVSPDDVKAVAEPVIAHRLIVAPEARSAGLSAEALIREAVEKTPVPV
jgi:MoxR-like ATPase